MCVSSRVRLRMCASAWCAQESVRRCILMYVSTLVYVCTNACVRSSLCVNMRASELFGLKYSMNQHCSSWQFPSLLKINIPRRLKTKNSEIKMQVPLMIQKPLPYLKTAVRIQKSATADVSEPSRPSAAADLSLADGVARNGTDAKTHQ